jgi:hypothetical protein
MLYVYSLGNIARSLLSTRNIIVTITVLVIGNILLFAYTPSIGGDYGVVINTKPREFFDLDNANPYKVVSSCTVTVQFSDRYGTEIKQVLDKGCVYKPGDKIERYLKARNQIYSVLIAVITCFILVVIPAWLIPKHPSINPL